MQKTKKRLLKLISYKRVIKNSVENHDIYNSRYLYPIHDEVLRGLIEGQDGVQKIEEYIENHNEDFLNLIEEYKDIIGNGYFNPYKPYRLAKYYEKSESFEKLEKIFKYKINPRIKKNIIHVGDKGSGKTAMQNCWLNEHNDPLEKENIFWVRCDGHKLYQLWLDCFDIIEKKRKEEEEDRLVVIQDYLDLQLLYVFAKYCMNEKRPFFKKMLYSIKDVDVQFDYPMGKWDKNVTESRNLYKTILKIRNTIIKEESEKIKIKHGYSYLIDEVMRKSFISHQREKRRWLAVSHKLQNLLTQNEFWFLKIVDGVDNVHINEKRTVPYYERMIRECHKFISERPPENEIRFLSLRERTLIDIGRIPITNTAPNPIGIRKIQHIPSCLKKISCKRYEYFKNSFDQQSLFGKIYSHVVSSIEPHINDLHHNNTRTFLYNKASLIMQVYYRVKQLGGNTSTIKSNIELLDSRNRFLNGRLFLDTFNDFTEEMNSELGLCCMNIFFFNIEEYPCNNPDQWYGLCKTRILQFLNNYSSIKEEALVEVLNLGIGYPKELVISDINDLRAFGMIDTKLDDGLVYVINEKGRIYLERSYSNIDTIYYFALDSPLPVHFIEQGYINSHENKLSRRTNFPYACISSAVSFMKYVNNINSIESRKLNRNKQKLSKFNLTLPLQLQLPWSDRKIYRQLIESGVVQINASDRINLDNINIYINKATEQWH